MSVRRTAGRGDLAEIRGALEALGYTVVPHGEELCVRLPLACSIRIRDDQGRMRFRSKFGPFGRTGGLMFTSVVASAGVLGALLYGTPLLAAGVGFVGVVGLVHDACRFVITESALTRLQQVALERE